MHNWDQIFIGIQICLSIQLILVCIVVFFDRQQKSSILSAFCLLLLQIPILHIFRYEIQNTAFLYIIFGSWKGFFYGPLLYLYLKSLNANGTKTSVLPHLIVPAVLVFLALIGHFFFNTGDIGSVFAGANVVGATLKTIGYLSYWLLIVLYFIKGVKEYRVYWNKSLKPKAKTRFYSFYIITNSHLLSTIVPGLILFLSLATDSPFIESMTTDFIAPYYKYVAMPQYMLLFAFLIFYCVTESKLLKRIYLSENIFTDNSFTNNETLEIVFNHAFEDKKIYRNPDLTIDGFSLNEKIKKDIIRKYILNRGFKSFPDFVNQYRVNDFIEKLESDQYNKLTFESIAEESGFTSRATFYRVFKNLTGMTPAAYKNYISGDIPQ